MAMSASFKASLVAHAVAAVRDIGERTAVHQAGVPSSVCTRLGLIASFISAVIAPSACRSRAKIGLPA